MKPKIPGMLALGLLAGPMAVAAPLTYDEAASGDIPYSGTLESITTIFDLDVGTNTVSGTQSGLLIVNGEATSFEADLDPFRFVVPTGAELYSFSIRWANAQLSGIISGGITSCILADNAFAEIQREGGSARSRCVDLIASTEGNRDLFLASLPLPTQIYGWFGTAGIGVSGLQGSWSVDYVLNLGVRRVADVVPEPGTLALFSLGLAGLGLGRRRTAC